MKTMQKNSSKKQAVLVFFGLFMYFFLVGCGVPPMDQSQKSLSEVYPEPPASSSTFYPGDNPSETLKEEMKLKGEKLVPQLLPETKTIKTFKPSLNVDFAPKKVRVAEAANRTVKEVCGEFLYMAPQEANQELRIKPASAIYAHPSVSKDLNTAPTPSSIKPGWDVITPQHGGVLIVLLTIDHDKLKLVLSDGLGVARVTRSGNQLRLEFHPEESGSKTKLLFFRYGKHQYKLPLCYHSNP